MATIDTSGDTQIGRDWIRSVALTVVCLCIALTSLYGTQIEPDSYYAHRFHSASFLMMPVFLILFAFTTFRLFVPWGAPVRMSSLGFIDLRAGHQIIPWNEIRNVVRRGDFVTLTLKWTFAKSYRMSLTQRAIKSMRKSAGPSHVLVAEWCLEAGPNDLLDLLTAYWKRYADKVPVSRTHTPGPGG